MKRPRLESALWLRWNKLQGGLLVLLSAFLIAATTERLGAGQADLGIYFNAFFSANLNPGNHPDHLSFYIYNDGFDAYTGPLTVEIIFSRNSVLGDTDDLKVGQMSFYVSLPSGSSTNVDLWYNTDAALLANFTVPSSACGDYAHPFMRLSFPPGSGYADPYPNNNVSDLNFTLHVSNPTGAAPAVQSIVRQSPSAATNNASAVTWRVTFTEDVTGVDLSDFTLRLLGGSLSGASKSGLHVQSPTVADVTVTTGTGNGVLRLDVLTPVTIYNTCEVPLSPSYSSGQTYTIGRTGPLVLSIVPISPDPVHGPISYVDVTFSEAINVSSLTYQRLTLTRDGSPVTLDGTINASLLSGSTYRINDLANFTAASGNYVITVSGAGVTDPLGNQGGGSISDGWNNILSGNQVVFVNASYSGSAPNGSALNPFTTITNAYNAAQSGNTLLIHAANYNEAITMNKQLVLQATNGIVNIGRP